MITDLRDRVRMEIKHLKVKNETRKQDLIYNILVDTQHQEFRRDVTKPKIRGPKWQAIQRWV